MKNTMEKQRGFTLVEQLVYLTLVVVLTVIISGIIADVARSANQVSTYTEVQQSSRLVLARIAQEIKTSRRVVSLSSTALSLEDVNGITRQISYSSATESVRLTSPSTNEPLSSERVRVISLVFRAVGNNAVEITIETEQGSAPRHGISPYRWRATTIAVPRPIIY